MAGPHVAATAYPAADLDRRFHAFLVDRLVAWVLYAAAVWAAWALWFSHGSVLPGLLLVVGVVLVVGLASAVVLGVTGTSPGKAVTGLRVVQVGTDRPIGVGPALLRTLILGAGTLPTFGLGVATLAQTAVLDPSRQRRGWHDRVAGSVVVDVRPVPELPETVAAAPRQIVNLTAMRLVPARADVPAPAAPPPAPPPGAPLGPPLGPPPGPPPAWRPPAPPPGPPPALAAPGPASYDPERTVVRSPGGEPRPAAPRPTATWRVRFDTGETFLVEGLGLIGRRPEPRPGEPVRHVVALPSQDLSLSKTHAQFQVAPDGALVVLDRGSTNGSTLVRSGVARSLPVGRPTTLVHGDEVKFGDRSMQVFREA